MEITTCKWFVLCDNEAIGTVEHPAIGSVPICRACADMLDLDVDEEDEEDGEGQ